MIYDPNDLLNVAIVAIPFLGSLIAFGYVALKLHDNRGRFRISTLLVLMVAVGVFIVVVRILLLIPF